MSDSPPHPVATQKIVEDFIDAAATDRMAAAQAWLARFPDAPAWRDAANGWTALHHAAFEGHERMAGMLLGAGAQIDAADSDGVTPLMLAANMGKKDCARLLLERGADWRA